MPLCVGLAKAVELMDGVPADQERDRQLLLRDTLVSHLLRLDGVQLNGTVGGARHPGNANIRFAGLDGRDILAALQPLIAASVGSACTSGIQHPSHVLRAIGLSGEEADSSVRFCVGRRTTALEVERACELIGEAVLRLRAAQRGPGSMPLSSER